MRDPYEVLGVSRKASDAEIKKAFRTAAKKHHPDTHGNDPAKVKLFQEVSGAYEVIGDKESARNTTVAKSVPTDNPGDFNPGAQGFGGGRGGPGGGGPFHWSGGGGGEGFKAEDIFADILGGFAGGGARGGRRSPQRGEDIQLSTAVTLEEAVQGGVRRVILGDGRQVEVRIPASVKDGQQIRLRGQGGPGARGGPAGDVLIHITIAPHPQFRREGKDLHLDLPVSLKEAVLGGKVSAPTLSGPVSLTVPPHSNSLKVLRLKGKGLPGSDKDEPGDLYVRLIIQLPETADPKLDEFLKNWPSDHDPRAKR